MRRWFGYDLRVWRLISDDSNCAVDINGIRAEFTPEELDEAQDFDDSLGRQFDRRYPHVVQLCNEWWAELNPPVEELAVEGPGKDFEQKEEN
jgi:hypothetical protein